MVVEAEERAWLRFLGMAEDKENVLDVSGSLMQAVTRDETQSGITS